MKRKKTTPNAKPEAQKALRQYASGDKLKSKAILELGRIAVKVMDEWHPERQSWSKKLAEENGIYKFADGEIIPPTFRRDCMYIHRNKTVAMEVLNYGKRDIVPSTWATRIYRKLNEQEEQNAPVLTEEEQKEKDEKNRRAVYEDSKGFIERHFDILFDKCPDLITTKDGMVWAGNVYKGAGADLEKDATAKTVVTNLYNNRKVA